MEHTPTPWRIVTNNWKEDNGHYEEGMNIENDDTIICSIAGGIPTYEAEANAAFIVRAVNCHDELVSILKGILQIDENRRIELPNYLYNDIKKALAKATKQ